ncbi:acetoin dehydrogenase [Rhodococcus sp. 05-340-1]|uniref:SDR family NAD(P)-dependent oxidoreductase n=1 Tax=Nocardiaceae TaxID=85025 RepID=UPI0009E705C1|nr:MULTISPECIES: SDR family NAD(P)-dependent oxidoreductase [Rhodococcus]OZC87703.1 acetoin dehydrogenase [Rhodococcus sp. 06-412-2C]OZC96354.1 acetoin dehydrogenase [Rhodococcus sp. 06-412-2B]OZD65338.1 acetoin dehydrogenase [Rhodococcus sp. 05-340-2]OZD74616.1 acetoin dehydrogenase [Rhodococcus sp. 05-340-1]OZD86611.1 acetoin dehydrogenase [Rhodococcus sp. 05-339-2]
MVITGAASGIGRALARRLSAHGCPIALADVDEHGLAETARSIGTPTLIRRLDVRSASDVDAFAGDVRDWSPRPIGAVFNNAGVAVQASVADGNPEDDRWLWDINFHGVVNGTRAFLPLFIGQGNGVIVNTSSVYGLLAVPHHSAYCASKFAVRGYTESLRQELAGTGVRSVTVHPGGIKTNIARDARVAVDPEGRGRTAEQIAEAFDAAAMTSPERAAETIHRGVDRGRSRILVGPDAVAVDLASRLAPSHAARALRFVEARLSGT